MKKVKVKSLSLCPTLCDPMDYSPPSSSVHGILQARILEWVAIPTPGEEEEDPGDLPDLEIKPGVSCFAGRFFTI